ncbi:DDE endonuclease [Candidatus Vampirococcus lugosii]|uniref:DDE endonuclease n=1 Tax=Candidatus Vampirococcus lugosii TaxID=2789015 RepID=A0ABS5QLN2_9BACT|nr:DDE endonuclease [Candidatus Vampirococcus lugosii]
MCSTQIYFYFLANPCLNQEFRNFFLQRGDKIRNEYRNGKKIVIILDNAKYNHAKEVQILAEKLGIKLCYLPPYSPNLNLIERVWKFLKKVLKNTYTPNFLDFIEKIKAICGEFNLTFKEKLSSLLNNKIQIIR